MKKDEDFNLYEKALKENPLHPAEECYIQIEKLIMIVSLDYIIV